ncbi:hypothetical protein [Geoalkalibacter subterraneus]|uniref:Uncharacterized protein n=1 Tax=Geoalkalibacter subterraneus TaxID=483547 RepID=A0A0B5FXI6_9BACT|nr:hypothetical protein [Geoalkalibacter subterraneus]AJF08301.1 hypothetical protein GSUB_17660 [Geoalkalibacter subterraneus]
MKRLKVLFFLGVFFLWIPAAVFAGPCSVEVYDSNGLVGQCETVGNYNYCLPTLGNSFYTQFNTETCEITAIPYFSTTSPLPIPVGETGVYVNESRGQYFEWVNTSISEDAAQPEVTGVTFDAPAEVEVPVSSINLTITSISGGGDSLECAALNNGALHAGETAAYQPCNEGSVLTLALSPYAGDEPIERVLYSVFVRNTDETGAFSRSGSLRLVEPETEEPIAEDPVSGADSTSGSGGTGFEFAPPEKADPAFTPSGEGNIFIFLEAM